MAAQDHLSRRGFLAHTLAAGAAGLLAPQVAHAAQAGVAPAGWRVGIYTRPWAKYEYQVALDAIAEAGFKYAGLMTAKSKDKSGLVLSMNTSLDEAQTIGEEAKKRGLSIASVYGGDFPVKKGSMDEGIRGLRKLIDNVAAVGCKSLLLGGTGSADLHVPYYKTVAECCDYAAEKGMVVTVKPHGGLNATGPQCRKCVELVGKKNFGIMYDPGNIFFYSKSKLDPVEDSAMVDGLVLGMCVKDYLPADDEKAFGKVDVTPGTGKVNFPAVFVRLKKGGFTAGPVVIECLAPGDDLKATLAEAKKARAFVEKLVQG